MKGPVSGELLSSGGKVLVHDNPAELEFLFANMKVVELGSMIPPEDTMSIKDHPDMASVRWPLNPEDFRR